MLREFIIGNEIFFCTVSQLLPKKITRSSELGKVLFWAGIRWPMGSQLQLRHQPQNPAITITDFLAVRINLGLLLKDRKKNTGGGEKKTRRHICAAGLADLILDFDHSEA